MIKIWSKYIFLFLSRICEN